MRKNKVIAAVALIFSGLLIFCQDNLAQTDRYEANWESLSKVRQTPYWFLDSKFGIYTHWGPVSEAMEGADPDKHYAGWHGMVM